MAYVTYTAVDRGSLVSGHSAGIDYTIEFDAIAIERNQRRVNEESRSLSGKTETVRHRKEITWGITSDYVEHSGLANWYEFLDSVDAGESFTLDPYGTVASPDDPLTVILDGDPQEPRIGAIKSYNIRFRAREA